MKSATARTRAVSETAGQLLSAAVPRVSAALTLGEVVTYVQSNASTFDSVNYIYVVDADGVLEGVFSIKELYANSATASVAAIMTTPPVTVRASTDQERVALQALRHNLKAIPVVDKHHHLLGVVASDTIMQILHVESVEDALRYAGAGSSADPVRDLLDAKAWFHVRQRLPWLVLGLFGGIAAAVVVRLFEASLEEYLLLAAFIPAVVYMADAVGSQAQIIFIRSLAMTKTLEILPYLWRELRVAVLLGAVLGCLAWLVAGVWVGFYFGLMFAVSIFLTIHAAMFTAIALPWALYKLSFDPAIASGPFATVVRDILSILIYFATAFAFL